VEPSAENVDVLGDKSDPSFPYSPYSLWDFGFPGSPNSPFSPFSPFFPYPFSPSVRKEVEVEVKVAFFGCFELGLGFW
jgi:hypothetical protein